MASKSTVAAQCRDSREGYLPPEKFRLTACAGCYRYLHGQKYAPTMAAFGVWVGRFDTTADPPDPLVYYLADVWNTTRRQLICDTMDMREDCDRWETCCLKAEKCCYRQTTMAPVEDMTCPTTWDGFDCWDPTAAGTTVYRACPNFIQHVTSTGTTTSRPWARLEA